ncbi:MAG: hypothetical protein LBD10_14590 [Desulfobulbus sp.]|uniref:hypothetical protein n=1 Tax=Desulfobulbus sp. TaxID=895 RepID=UPI00284C6B8F|nr:hypothetical protein [Desulfobulbus sp.]MDR2551417.1 hypothetical protein [Desulfobulbus sp.]
MDYCNEKQEKTHRRYQIPRKLAPMIAHMMDRMDGPNRSIATLELWSFLADRCPEVKEGNWSIVHKGYAIFLEEQTD